MPIRDRIDIVQAFVPLSKTFLKVAAKCPSEPSAVVAGRVADARETSTPTGRYSVADQR